MKIAARRGRRKRRGGTEIMEPWQFMQKQRLPYEAKIRHAEIRAREFYDELNGDVFCSVGGLDSITLLLFLRKYVSKNIPAISVSVLEDKRSRKFISS